MTLAERFKPQLHKIYRAPRDILRDRRFNDATKLDFLEAWACADDAETAEVERCKAEIRARARA